MASSFQKILIIDDDSVDRFILKKAIQKNRISDEILEAETGIEALKMLADFSTKGEALPDLLFLDVNMPLLDGFGFLNTIELLHSQYHKRFHIVVICSIHNEMEKQRALKYDGVINYFVKPVLDEQLIKLIDRMQRTKAS